MLLMIARIARHLFLLVYIFLTICALLYTLGRKHVPHVPWPFVTHFYAMMAPFQHYLTYNVELTAYSKYADGTWEKINLQPYLPFGRGEAAIRMRMSSFHDKQEKYYALGHKVLLYERARGEDIVAVRVLWESWPKSQYSFYENYIEGKITKKILADVVP